MAATWVTLGEVTKVGLISNNTRPEVGMWERFTPRSGRWRLTDLDGSASKRIPQSQVEKSVMKPIILQVSNRNAISENSIRPNQAMFSGLQNPPDSGQCTPSIHKFRVRIPASTRVFWLLSTTPNC